MTDNMTTTEKRIAKFLIMNYDETEDSYPYFDYRYYLPDAACGIINSQGEMHDALMLMYTKNLDKKVKYVQVFLSSDDDMCQDFVYLSELTDEEVNKIVNLIEY